MEVWEREGQELEATVGLSKVGWNPDSTCWTQPTVSVLCTYLFTGICGLNGVV